VVRVQPESTALKELLYRLAVHKEITRRTKVLSARKIAPPARRDPFVLDPVLTVLPGRVTPGTTALVGRRYQHRTQQNLDTSPVKEPLTRHAALLVHTPLATPRLNAPFVILDSFAMRLG